MFGFLCFVVAVVAFVRISNVRNTLLNQKNQIEELQRQINILRYDMQRSPAQPVPNNKQEQKTVVRSAENEPPHQQAMPPYLNPQYYESPYQGAPYQAVPYQEMPYQEEPYQEMPYHEISYQEVPYQQAVPPWFGPVNQPFTQPQPTVHEQPTIQRPPQAVPPVPEYNHPQPEYNKVQPAAVSNLERKIVVQPVAEKQETIIAPEIIPAAIQQQESIEKTILPPNVRPGLKEEPGVAAASDVQPATREATEAVAAGEWLEIKEALKAAASEAPKAAASDVRPAIKEAPGVAGAPEAPKAAASDVRPEIKKEPQKPRRRTLAFSESMVGKNVLGIAASVMIFVGLIFLGRLIYDSITDEIKIAFLFAISALITGLGVLLSKKSRNAFTVILTGCGCGSFFISIMLTHVYFNKLNDIAAFSLLLVWTAITLYLAKRLASVSLSIVAHMGMVFSICFAYALGLSDEKLVMLMVYQLVSTAVITVGNILCCRKTYRFGIFVSLALTIIASGFMWNNYQPSIGADYIPFTNTGLSLFAISTAIIIQFLCASFLSYLLAVSTNRVDDRRPRQIIHLCNKALWIGALFLNPYRLIYRITYDQAVASGAMDVQLTAILAAAVAGMIILILHAVLTIWMSLKIKFNKELETLSVLILSGISFALLIILWFAQIGAAGSFPRLAYLIVPGFLLLLAKRISRNRVYSIAAVVFFASDFIYMLSYGYRQLTQYGTIWLAIGYMLIYTIAVWLLWCGFDSEQKEKYNITARLSWYIMIEASLIDIFLTSALPNKIVILLLVMTALNFLLFLFKFDRNTKPGNLLYDAMRLNEVIWIAVSAGCIAFLPKDNVSYWLYLLLTVFALGLSFVRIKEHLFTNGIRSFEEGFYVLKIAALVMAPVYGYTTQLPYQLVVLLLSITGLSIVFHFLRLFLYRFHKRSMTESAIDIVMRANEFLWVAVDVVCIALVPKGGANFWLYLLLAVLAMWLSLTRIKKSLFTDGIHHAEEGLYILKITAVMMAAAYSATVSSAYRAAILLLVITCLSILFHVLSYYLYRHYGLNSLQSPYDRILRGNELLWVVVDACFIAFSPKDAVSNVLYLTLTALATGLAFMRVNDVIDGDRRPFNELIIGLKLTGLTMAVVYGHTAWFQNTFVFSLVCMVTALVCVIAGFIWLAKTLRLYGLVLILICVLKLVTYDVAGLSLPLRVVVLISGGVICFVISAVYSYSSKKIGDVQKKENEEEFL